MSDCKSEFQWRQLFWQLLDSEEKRCKLNVFSLYLLLWHSLSNHQNSYLINDIINENGKKMSLIFFTKMDYSSLWSFHAFASSSHKWVNPSSIEIALLRFDYFAIDGASVHFWGIERNVVFDFGEILARLGIKPARWSWNFSIHFHIIVLSRAFPFTESLLAWSEFKIVHVDVLWGNIVAWWVWRFKLVGKRVCE